MKLFIFALLTIFSLSTYASTLFTGEQARTNHTCTLEVLHTYSTDPANELATEMSDVRVSFVDGGHGASRPVELDFTVALNTAGNTLSSTGANGRDILQVEITNGTRGFAAPVRYGARFLHGAHFHSVQCLNLSL